MQEGLKMGKWAYERLDKRLSKGMSYGKANATTKLM
jgi:uncharacterized protein YoaH (UPF0181 family)